MTPYELLDCEEMNREHPDRFEIPASIVRHNLSVGSFAKLCYVAPDGAERMWVRVAETTNVGYVATLENHPMSIDLIAGNTVVFGAHHVMAVVTLEEAP